MSTELRDFAAMGKKHARHLTPDIICYAVVGGGWWRSGIAKDWSDEECRLFAVAFDQERNSLHKLSEDCSL